MVMASGKMELIRTDCLLCRSDSLRPLYPFTPPDMGGRFFLERCAACGGVMVNPHPDGRELINFFSDERIFLATRDPEGRPRSLAGERNRRAGEFSGYVKRIRRMAPEGRALDVGCGLGLFLELLGPGYHRLGLEINPLAADFMENNLDFEVRAENAMETEFEPHSFDLISIMQTLDHLEDPGLFLKRASSWLAPGGVLFLSSLINIKSIMSGFFREDFRLLHPFHLVYFTPTLIRKLLAGLGFRTVHLEYPYFKTPFFTWSSSLDLLKKCAGRIAPGRRSSHVPSPPFIGNTINVYARKEL